MVRCQRNYQPPGGLINAYINLKARRSRVSKQYDELGEQMETIQNKLLAIMNKQGVDRIIAHGRTVSKTSLKVPSVKDWDALGKYIIEGNRLYLLQRRMSSDSYRDELEAREGKLIPGVETFEKKGISIRAT